MVVLSYFQRDVKLLKARLEIIRYVEVGGCIFIFFGKYFRRAYHYILLAGFILILKKKQFK